MKTEISNRQNHRLHRKNLATFLRFLSRKLPQSAPDGAWTLLTVVLVDDAGIRAAHENVFGKPRTTDVIALRYDPLPGEPGIEGEVIVNVDEAIRLPVHKRNWTPSRELALYVAHGIDHLAGGEDRTPDERRRMRRRELRWLREADRSGALAELL